MEKHEMYISITKTENRKVWLFWIFAKPWKQIPTTILMLETPLFAFSSNENI